MKKFKNDEYNTPEGAMKVLKVIGMVLLGIAACFAFGLAIMLLWNWLMPMIFGLTVITYWQGIGILALASILFGRFGGGGSSEKKKHRKKGDRPIRDSIKEEIRKEFEKEYKKEAAKEEGKQSNMDYEQMYEKWWAAEGENRFEEYMSGSKKDD
ncbi:MAG: hypothetical protein HN948_09535 [Clostridia bacterium]|nr:hypothetical protein [Clostridia bacterium]MBT7123234.1 hypothetical protein [Clostridia bacterium]